jgi:hypothetical protein
MPLLLGLLGFSGKLLQPFISLPIVYQYCCSFRQLHSFCYIGTDRFLQPFISLPIVYQYCCSFRQLHSFCYIGTDRFLQPYQLLVISLLEKVWLIVLI